jgi:hypothetical protein
MLDVSQDIALTSTQPTQSLCSQNRVVEIKTTIAIAIGSGLFVLLAIIGITVFFMLKPNQPSGFSSLHVNTPLSSLSRKSSNSWNSLKRWLNGCSSDSEPDSDVEAARPVPPQPIIPLRPLTRTAQMRREAAHAALDLRSAIIAKPKRVYMSRMYH